MVYSKSSTPFLLCWVLATCALWHVCEGTTKELATFEEVRNFVLEEYGIISAVVDATKCETPEDSKLKNAIILEHLNDVWLFGRVNGSEVFRATSKLIKWNWKYVHTVLTEQGKLSLNIIEMDRGTLAVLSNETITCKLGEGATLLGHDVIQAREEFSNYQELKEAFLSGKDLVARALVSDCPGPNWPSLGIERFQAHYTMKNAKIWDEGTPEERITFDVWFVNDEYSSFVKSPVALEAVTHTIRPSGSARIVPGAIDFYTYKVDHWFSVGYNCTIGSSYRVSAPSPSKDNTVRKLNTYQETYEEAFAGKAISSVLNTKQCNWSTGSKPDSVPEVLINKFSLWLHGTETEEYGTFLEFFDLQFNRDPPKKILEKFYLSENNTVKYLVLTLDMIAKSQTLHSASCEVGSAITFTSTGSQAGNELVTFDELKEALVEKAEFVDFVVEYKKCEGPKTFLFDGHGGGVVNPAILDLKNELLLSPGSHIGSFLPTGEAIRAQQPLTINPDGKVTIDVTKFMADGSNSQQIGETESFKCQLGEGIHFFLK